MKIKLTHDVYNISKRIKQIDLGYYVVYNTELCKFEIHNSNQIGSTYCLTLPYTELDERTLNYVAKTRSINVEKILEEIENNNKIQENQEKRKTFSQLNESVLDNFKEK